jgi:hypothetical protein
MVLGVVAVGLISSTAMAQELSPARLDLQSAIRATFTAAEVQAQAPAPAPAPARPVKVIGGIDFPTVYFFRGYRQETDPEFTAQPFVDVGFAASDAVALNVGLWNSIHTGSLSDEPLDAGWYETDFYVAATTGMLKTTYTAYTYPSFDDATIHELMFTVSVPHMLAPSVNLAFEFAKPEGLDKGVYLDFGINPAIPTGGPVTVTVPIKIGLSLKDYYGEDTFGYFSGGLNVLVPLSPNFDIHGGVQVLGLGDHVKNLNVNADGETSAGQFIGTIGLGFSF